MRRVGPSKTFVAPADGSRDTPFRSNCKGRGVSNFRRVVGRRRHGAGSDRNDRTQAAQLYYVYKSGARASNNSHYRGTETNGRPAINVFEANPRKPVSFIWARNATGYNQLYLAKMSDKHEPKPTGIDQGAGDPGFSRMANTQMTKEWQVEWQNGSPGRVWCITSTKGAHRDAQVPPSAKSIERPIGRFTTGICLSHALSGMKTIRSSSKAACLVILMESRRALLKDGLLNSGLVTMRVRFSPQTPEASDGFLRFKPSRNCRIPKKDGKRSGKDLPPAGLTKEK